MNKKRFYVLLLILFASLIIVFPFVNKYLSKVNSFEPVIVKICGNINKNVGQIKVIGITPRGKERVFENINAQIKWYSYYSFYTDIIIACDSNIFKNIDSLNIVIGQMTYHYNKSNFLTKWKIEYIEHKTYNNKIYCHIPKETYTNASIFRKVLSVRNWTIVKYCTKIIAIFFIILFVIYFRSFVYTRLKKITFIINRNYYIILQYIFKAFRVIKSIPIITKLLIILNIAFLFLLLVFIHYGQFFLLGYYLLLVFMMLIYLLLMLVFKLLNSRKDKVINMQIFVFSLFVILNVVEFGLRKSKLFITYMETRGNCQYHSFYTTSNKSIYNLPIANRERIISTSEYNYNRFSNSLGLSEKELKAEKDTGTIRIIGIGDSFTEGDGTHADSTWMKFLEHNLNNKKLEFINAGICGSDPFYEYNLLHDKLLKYKPELVLVAINQSDISDVIIRGGFERFKNNSTVSYNPAPKWEFLYQHIHLVRLIAHKLFKCDDFLLTPSEQKYKAEEALYKIKQVLLAFKTLAENNKFEIIIIFHPVKSEILNKKFQYFNTLLDFCKKNNIQYINLIDYFIKLNLSNSEINSIFWKHDGHHNAKGYSFFSNGVEFNLKKLGILDSLIKK